MIATLIQLLMFITPAICAATLALKYAELKSSGASVAWPATKGKITESQIVPTGKKVKGQNLYSPEVTLRYEVEGKPYTVKQRPSSPDGLSEGSKQWAREMSLKYKPGAVGRLYYNPKRPKQATIQPGVSTVNARSWLVAGGVMLFFSFILHMLSVMALSQRFSTLPSSSSAILGIITFVVMLMIGALTFLLAQEIGEKSPA